MPSNSRHGSVDCGDECFYSFPSSRNASHEVSSTTNDSSEEYDRTPKSTCSINTALDKDALLLDAEADQDHDEMAGTSTPRSSKVKWTLPFVQQKDSPRHHHFCSKPVLSHLCRNNRLPSGFYRPSDGSYIHEYASSLPDEPVTIEQLVSSPAAPVMTRHWSSTSIGSSLWPSKPRSTGQVYFDSQEASSLGVEDIVANIRTYLSTMRHVTCTPSPREQPRSISFMARNPISTPNEEPESFLVSTNDIAGILDIVIIGLRRLHGEHLPSGCLSVLLPWNQSNRPVTKADSIIPSASCPAEPATTISSVKPAVTKAHSLHARSLANKSFKATIISKKSVAEVSWESTPGCSCVTSAMTSENSSRRASVHHCISSCSTCGSQAAATSGINSQRRQSSGRHSEPSCDSNFPKSLISLCKGRKHSHGGRVSAPDEMNHPPPEQVQSCGRVKNWIKTSDGHSQQLSRDAGTSTLYHRGVDAHPEAPSPESTSSRAEEERPKLTVSSEEICGNKKRQPADTSTINDCDSAPHDRRSSESDMADPSLHKLHRYSLMPLEDQTPESLRSSEQRRVCLGHSEEVPLRGQPSTPGKATLEDILTRFIYFNDEPRRPHATDCCCTASRSK